MNQDQKLQNLKSQFSADYQVWFDNPHEMNVKIADKSLKDTTFAVTAYDGGFQVVSDKGTENFKDEAEVLNYFKSYVKK